MGQSLVPIQARVSYRHTDALLGTHREELTDGRVAFRRKKALHDTHVSTSKFIPRALSPQIRQIKGGRTVRLVTTSRLSMIVENDDALKYAEVGEENTEGQSRGAFLFLSE